jgi:YegS/Rv2252/BmrU family lipid kinase
VITVIINPISGGATPELARRRAELAARIVSGSGEEAEVFVSERKGHARELAAKAKQRGARLIVAWGGDGTVNEVASTLAFGDTPIGILPSGSGNGLASDLKIPPEPERAISEMLGARPRAIDAGELNGRLFFSLAGVGFDAHVATLFDRQPVGRRGFRGYVRLTCRELLRYRPGNYRISGDVVLMANRALLVTIANSTQFGNGARVAPAARVDDGRLDLVVLQEQTRLRTVCSLPNLFTGTAARVPGVLMEQIERVTIESDAPMAFHLDGEPGVAGTRIDARVHPGALKVAVR